MKRIFITHAVWDFMMVSMAGTIHSSIHTIHGDSGITHMPIADTMELGSIGMIHGISQVGMAIPTIGVMAILIIGVMAILTGVILIIGTMHMVGVTHTIGAVDPDMDIHHVLKITAMLIMATPELSLIVAEDTPRQSMALLVAML